MNGATPTPKVAAAGIAASIVTILVWVLNSLAIDVPPAVAAAMATLVAFAAGYIKKPA